MNISALLRGNVMDVTSVQRGRAALGSTRVGETCVEAKGGAVGENGGPGARSQSGSIREGVTRARTHVSPDVTRAAGHW